MIVMMMTMVEAVISVEYYFNEDEKEKEDNEDYDNDDSGRIHKCLFEW